jgi:hypothetical protein
LTTSSTGHRSCQAPRRIKIWCWVWIAALISATFVVNGAALQSLLSPQALPPLAKLLRQQYPPGTRIYTWQVRPSRAGLLRLLTGGALPLVELPANSGVPDCSNASLVVTTSPHQLLFQQAGYDVAQIKPEVCPCPSIQNLVRRFYPRRTRKELNPREILWLATRRLERPQ